MRQSMHLTDLQRLVLIGTLLGDGSLVETSSKKNLRLKSNMVMLSVTMSSGSGNA